MKLQKADALLRSAVKYREPLGPQKIFITDTERNPALSNEFRCTGARRFGIILPKRRGGAPIISEQLKINSKLSKAKQGK